MDFIQSLLAEGYFALFLIIAIAYVIGRIKVKGVSLDVSADEVEFLSPRGQDEGGAPAPRQTAAPQDLAGFTDIQSDDIPF